MRAPPALSSARADAYAQRLDPFSGGPKKSNLFFRLVKVFLRSFFLQACLFIIYVRCHHPAHVPHR